MYANSDAAPPHYGRVSPSKWIPMGTGAEHGSRDLYEVLEIAHNASADQIRASFRRLAAENHPDRNPGDRKAALRFKRINAAYQVLGDEVKRCEYDRLTTPIEDVDEPARGPAPGGPSDVPPHQSEVTSRGAGPAYYRAAVPPRATGTRGVLRTVLTVFGVLTAVAVIGIGGVVWYAVTQDAKYRAEQESVTVTADYRPDKCTAEHPILVAIENNGTRTVKAVSFEIEAYEVGRSDNLTGFGGMVDSTDVIKPAHTRNTCWSVPSFSRTPTRNVVFRAKKDFVTFYDENEFIPPDPTRHSGTGGGHDGNR